LTDSGPSGTLFDRQYGYNTANQISQITEPSSTRIFGYDNVNRLRTVLNGGTGENYSYDEVGNRTSSHLSSTYGYQTGFFNRLTSTQTATYNYDANGNTVSKSEGSNFWRYGFDYENRMYEAATRKQKVRYKYDALGRRVSRNFGHGKETTKFTYDGNDVLVDDNFGTRTKYLNGSGIDNKLRSTTGSTASYFLSDHLGSTNGLTNSSGAITASNGYDSFGNPTNTGFSSRYQFTGREFDNFTGLQFSRARFYDPKIGRFVSEDPIGFDGGDVNIYVYVKNNPLNKIDPFGLDDADIVFRDTEHYRELERQGRQFWDDVRKMRGPDWCGPAGNRFLGWLVPDSVGGFNFGGPCKSHDFCYSDCEKPKEVCDRTSKTILRMFAGRQAHNALVTPISTTKE
jgi:RHS repeat-associated protein